MSKETRLIDMKVDEQLDIFTKAAFDGMLKDGLSGMKDRLWGLVLTLHNQREDDKKKRPRGGA